MRNEWKSIRIYSDPLDVEQAMATRLGFDLIAPLEIAGKSFHRAAFPVVDLKKFIK